MINSNAQFFYAKGIRRPLLSTTEGPMTQAEAIVSAMLAQLAQGKIQNPADEACLDEVAPPSLGKALTLLCQRHAFREALTVMRNHRRDYSLRIMQYPGERLLHPDTRDVRSLVGAFSPGAEMTVMVNGAPEGQPFYFQGSVNFHFVSKGVARIFNSVTWQPWIDALAPVITLAKDMDEAIEAAALTPGGVSLQQSPLRPGSDMADATRELGAFLAVHGYVAAPAKDGQGWDAMDAVQCSRGGGIRWVEFEPVRIQTLQQANRFVATRGV